jgi:filamentous hemagglutinin
LGPASQLIIAIALAAVMGPMMAGMGTMVQAGAISVATKATVSTIDNRGNLGAVFKDVTSTDSIKGYAVSVATAGAAQSPGYDPGAMGFNAASLKTVMLKAAADATIKTAVYGGSFKDNLGSALLNTAASAGGAVAAGKIGDLGWVDGSLDKVLLHAALGGLMAEVMGSDFRTGAIAGGANEVLVGLLGDRLLPANLTPGTPEHVQAQANLVALSKIVGVLGAAATKGDLDVAAQVAENGTRYNLLGDHSAKLRDEAREKFSQTGDLKAARELVRLEGADQRSDELRAAYLRDPSSLSQKELAEFTAYLQVYAYERLKAVGPEKAQASLTSLLAGDQVFGYGYPYAGSKEQKLLWADAQRSQLGLLGSLWPHERSVDERTYLDAKHALRIGQELQGWPALAIRPSISWVDQLAVRFGRQQLPTALCKLRRGPNRPSKGISGMRLATWCLGCWAWAHWVSRSTRAGSRALCQSQEDIQMQAHPLCRQLSWCGRLECLLSREVLVSITQSMVDCLPD